MSLYTSSSKSYDSQMATLYENYFLTYLFALSIFILHLLPALMSLGIILAVKEAKKNQSYKLDTSIYKYEQKELGNKMECIEIKM